ncbi:MAG TPA: DNA cytosine methyltransferase [Bacteroidota bacterium]|nr:DNA cytosine methyltransferase [Bacteroidota bacterium]
MGYTQCHFFAGIGGWPRALRLAGFPDDRKIWTGSPPCQPFSAAGKRSGFADERHLWPALHHLLKICRPPMLYMEQVASKDGLHWLDTVQSDMENEGYAVAPFDLCAAGIGAHHKRQRLYIVAYADPERCIVNAQLRKKQSGDSQTAGSGEARGLADATGGQRNRWSGITDAEKRVGQKAKWGRRFAGRRPDIVGDTQRAGLEGHTWDATEAKGRTKPSRSTSETGESCPMADAMHAGRPERRTEPGNGQTARSGFWSDAEWIHCTDGKLRPAQPGAFPLDHGLPRSVGQIQPALCGLPHVADCTSLSLKRAKRNRLGRLKGYGNAIVPELAAEFIRATML